MGKVRRARTRKADRCSGKTESQNGSFETGVSLPKLTRQASEQNKPSERKRKRNIDRLPELLPARYVPPSILPESITDTRYQSKSEQNTVSEYEGTWSSGTLPDIASESQHQHNTRRRDTRVRKKHI